MSKSQRERERERERERKSWNDETKDDDIDRMCSTYEIRNEYKTGFGNLEDKRQYGRRMCRSEKNIKTIFFE